MTNYIHMVGSGHIGDFLLRWRNLYRHSQQGWEALNDLIKTFVHRRTQRGGNMGSGAGASNSMLLPIARWLQRRIFWILGGTSKNKGITHYNDAQEEDNGENVHDY